MNFIRNRLDVKEVLRLDKLIEDLPYDLVFSKEDIISLVENTDDLECPNSMVVIEK